MNSNNFKINKESIERLFPKQDINIVGYESPIEVAIGQMRTKFEDNVVKVVQERGIDVDKDELTKALQYDRGQYEKGYINGYNRKASEVAREIFAEIEKSFIEYYDKTITYSSPTLPLHIREAAGFSLNEMFMKIAELKKKYESEKENGI